MAEINDALNTAFKKICEVVENLSNLEVVTISDKNYRLVHDGQNWTFFQSSTFCEEMAMQLLKNSEDDMGKTLVEKVDKQLGGQLSNLKADEDKKEAHKKVHEALYKVISGTSSSECRWMFTKINIVEGDITTGTSNLDDENLRTFHEKQLDNAKKIVETNLSFLKSIWDSIKK